MNLSDAVSVIPPSFGVDTASASLPVREGIVASVYAYRGSSWTPWSLVAVRQGTTAGSRHLAMKERNEV